MNNTLYPCLWLESHAADAAAFYCSVFPNSRILSNNGMALSFELNGTRFLAIQGAKPQDFSHAVSFVIECSNQEEIDYYWNALGSEGVYEQCGWLKDKYGLSWQVVPSILPQLLSDLEKAPRVVHAFMQMSKFDIAALQNA